MKYLSYLILVSSIVLFSYAHVSAAKRPEIWLSSLDTLARVEGTHPGSKWNRPGVSDYMNLFYSTAPWANAAKQVQVFKIYSKWVTDGKDDDLRRQFADLNRRGIALALEHGALNESDKCGRDVEGFGGKNLVKAARRIQALGGELNYVAMDEPFFWGALYDGHNACHFSAQEIASEVEGNIKDVKTVFPNVLVGDIEPVPAPKTLDWLKRYEEWIDAFRETTGTPLRFFQVDVNWNRHSWQKDLDALREILGRREIHFGVIYNDSRSQTDEGYLDETEKRFSEYEKHSEMPDQAVFQSWHPHPTHDLPEQDPRAWTNIVLRYLKFQIHRAAQGSNPGPTAVTARKTPDGFENYELTGQVPSLASRAILAIRIHKECDWCPGAANLNLLRAVYVEGDESKPVVREVTGGMSQWDFRGNATTLLTPHSGLEIRAEPNQPYFGNSRPFPVTPGASYKAAFTAVVRGENSGNFSVIFLMENGKEIQRNNTEF